MRPEPNTDLAYLKLFYKLSQLALQACHLCVSVHHKNTKAGELYRKLRSHLLGQQKVLEEIAQELLEEAKKH